jgi:hypothetical protein
LEKDPFAREGSEALERKEDDFDDDESADDGEDYDEDDEAGDEPEELLGPPPGTTISIERFADGLTIQVPPGGLLGGTKGLFVFALLWDGAMTLFTAAMLAGFLHGEAKRDDSIWLPVLFLGLFWLVGVVMLLSSIQMGRRRAAIAVTAGSLMVIQSGPLGTKQRDWTPGDVSAVRAGPSGMEVNSRPVLELQVVDAKGVKFGLLAGRSDDELRWLAQELRIALLGPSENPVVG